VRERNFFAFFSSNFMFGRRESKKKRENFFSPTNHLLSFFHNWHPNPSLYMYEKLGHGDNTPRANYSYRILCIAALI